MQYLEVTILGEPLRRYPVGGEPLVIGRGDGCDIRIDRNGVRNRHAMVSRQLTVEGIDGGISAILHHGRQVPSGIIEVDDAFELDGQGDVRIALRRRQPIELGAGDEAEGVALRADVRRLENEKAALVRSVKELEDRLERLADRTGTASASVDDLALGWLREILDEPAGEDGTEPAAGGGAARLRFVLRALYDHARILEQTADAHLRINADADDTRHSLDLHLRALLTSAPSARSRNELRRYLGALRIRLVRASVASYRKGVERWIAGFLNRLWALRKRAGPPGRLDPLGSRFARLVGELENLLHQTTPDLVLDEIQECWQDNKEPDHDPVV